ncbi:hypothetical protein PR048_026900 [Dryococelus australis]|uniref:Uncharacterized protein n=1 Tax=Dryococelus australis TaxID=614101 RepID=A0ABQ9GMK5_9NEOP|nr:hypothetical protein PR048_026900 [Dryococelus australis]
MESKVILFSDLDKDLEGARRSAGHSSRCREKTRESLRRDYLDRDKRRVVNLPLKADPAITRPINSNRLNTWAARALCGPGDLQTSPNRRLRLSDFELINRDRGILRIHSGHKLDSKIIYVPGAQIGVYWLLLQLNPRPGVFSNYICRRWLLISDRDFEPPISVFRNELNLDLQSSSELEWCNNFLCRSWIRSRIDFQAMMVQPGISEARLRCEGKPERSLRHVIKTCMEDPAHIVLVGQGNWTQPARYADNSSGSVRGRRLVISSSHPLVNTPPFSNHSRRFLLCYTYYLSHIRWQDFDISILSSQGDKGSIPGRVTPDPCRWESCWTMPLVGGFSRGSLISPRPSFQRRSITLIGSQDLNVKSRPNLFTHFSFSYVHVLQKGNLRRYAGFVPHFVVRLYSLFNLQLKHFSNKQTKHLMSLAVACCTLKCWLATVITTVLGPKPRDSRPGVPTLRTTMSLRIKMRMEQRRNERTLERRGRGCAPRKSAWQGKRPPRFSCAGILALLRGEYKQVELSDCQTPAALPELREGDINLRGHLNTPAHLNTLRSASLLYPLLQEHLVMLVFMLELTVVLLVHTTLDTLQRSLLADEHESGLINISVTVECWLVPSSHRPLVHMSGLRPLSTIGRSCERGRARKLGVKLTWGHGSLGRRAVTSEGTCTNQRILVLRHMLGYTAGSPLFCHPPRCLARKGDGIVNVLATVALKSTERREGVEWVCGLLLGADKKLGRLRDTHKVRHCNVHVLGLVTKAHSPPFNIEDKKYCKVGGRVPPGHNRRVRCKFSSTSVAAMHHPPTHHPRKRLQDKEIVTTWKSRLLSHYLICGLSLSPACAMAGDVWHRKIGKSALGR